MSFIGLSCASANTLLVNGLAAQQHYKALSNPFRRQEMKTLSSLFLSQKKERD